MQNKEINLQTVEFISLLNGLVEMMKKKIDNKSYCFYQDASVEVKKLTTGNECSLNNGVFLDKSSGTVYYDEFNGVKELMFVEYELVYNYLCDDSHDSIISFFSGLYPQYDIVYRVYYDCGALEPFGDIYIKDHVTQEDLFKVTENGWKTLYY